MPQVRPLSGLNKANIGTQSCQKIHAELIAVFLGSRNADLDILQLCIYEDVYSASVSCVIICITCIKYLASEDAVLKLLKYNGHEI